LKYHSLIKQGSVHQPAYSKQDFSFHNSLSQRKGMSLEYMQLRCQALVSSPD